MNITEILVPAQQIAWLPWAVQYFFYIGSAYAAAILFLISYIFREQTSHYFRSALILVVVLGTIVGPLALTGDLHQPGRAWHFYFHLTTWSWMSLGSLFLPLFSALSAATAWLYLREDLASFKTHENKWFQKIALITLGDWKTTPKLVLLSATATVISGLSIALYTGAEISVVASRPLWNQLASPFLWFITAFMGAVGTALLLLILFPKIENKTILTSADVRLIKTPLILSGVLAMILLPIWASNNESFSLYEDSTWVVYLSLLSFGFLACILMAFLAEGVTKLCRVKLALISFVAIATCWYLRWVTMMEVQTIPKYDMGPYPYELPLLGSGLIAIVGIAGLWFAIALFASELIQKDNSASISVNNVSTNTLTANK